MDLSLQCGWGMMSLNKDLVSRWGGGTTILSPRDLDPVQLDRHAADLRGAGGTGLVDPQFYLPHADHERLCSHEYWPRAYSTGTFWSGPGLSELVNHLVQLNDRLGTRALILPGMLAEDVGADWTGTQNAVVAEYLRQASSRPSLLTIALTSDVVRDVDKVHEILDSAEQWQVPGYYLVCEHPRGEYLVEDPVWLANVLDLAAGLRLRAREVLLGYCTQQMLVASVAHVDSIASGNWMNVRSFPPEKFRVPDEDEERRKATWYYCPQVFSEYKMVYLDVAFEAGLLNEMAPDPAFGSTDVAKLFQGIRPTTVGFAQSPDSFRHYLHCLREQAVRTHRDTFDETLAQQQRTLDTAEALLDRFRRAGILGQNREFSDLLDVNRAALALFQARRGAIMRRRWSTL